jgi:two-component sensor histidine kinase
MLSVEDNLLSQRLPTNTEDTERLQVLLEGINDLGHTQELSVILWKSLELIQQVMGVQVSTIILTFDSKAELLVNKPSGPVFKTIDKNEVINNSELENGIKNNQPYYSNDPASDQLFMTDFFGGVSINNISCVPLKSKESTFLGLLYAMNRVADHRFADEDLRLFELLGQYIATIISRTRKLQQKSDDKEMMLTEIHHRLKNNLSAITALIEMELTEIEDESARAVLKKTNSRISSMMEVHNLLYDSDSGNQIDLKTYIERLVEKISATLTRPSQPVKINFQAESILIDSDRAMSCGLLLNELMVNCYKHAFKNRPDGGEISIELRQYDHNNVALKVSDDGIGISDNFKLDKSDSMGGWLVKVLLRRLDAAIDITRSDGTTFIIRFEK